MNKWWLERSHARQIQILDAIDSLVQQSPLGATTTQEIAALAKIPARSVRYYLRRLEQQGKIERRYRRHMIRRLPEGDVPPEPPSAGNV